MEDDLIKLKEFISMQKFQSNDSNKLGSYENAALICIDAVLSINRKYYKFVVPRISYFQDNYPEVDNLKKLLELLEKEKIFGFNKCWNYNHNQRAETLYNLTKKMITIANERKDLNELEVLKLWARTVSPIDYQTFNVEGIGLATFQYIRMMLGAKTIKPDVHVKRIITNVLNKKMSDMYVIALFERACNDLGMDIAEVEHNLWLKEASDYKEFDKEWDGKRWIKKI